MIPTLFSSVDVADARDRAMDFAAGFAKTVTHVSGPLTVSEVPAVRVSLSPLHLQVVCVDGVSPQATNQLLALVRSAAIIGYSTQIHTAPGIHVHSSGLRSDDSVYMSLSTDGMRPSEAAACARIGRGSADTGSQGLSALSSRARVIQMLDAVRAHDMSAVHATAAAFTGTDITMVRAALDEIATNDWALWSAREVEIFSTHRQFVAATISDYFVTAPASTALMLGMGLYFAECGLIS